jgi:hypothetical protein
MLMSRRRQPAFTIGFQMMPRRRRGVATPDFRQRHFSLIFRQAFFISLSPDIAATPHYRHAAAAAIYFADCFASAVVTPSFSAASAAADCCADATSACRRRQLIFFAASFDTGRHLLHSFFATLYFAASPHTRRFRFLRRWLSPLPLSFFTPCFHRRHSSQPPADAADFRR